MSAFVNSVANAATQSVTVSTQTATLVNPVAAGSTLIAVTKFGGGIFTNTPTDTQLNVYVLDKQLANGSGPTIQVFRVASCAAMTTADQVTVTTSTGQADWGFDVFALTGVVGAVDASGTATATSTTVACTTTAATAQVYEVAIAALAVGGTPTFPLTVSAASPWTQDGVTGQAPFGSAWLDMVGTTKPSVSWTVGQSETLAAVVVTYQVSPALFAAPRRMPLGC